MRHTTALLACTLWLLSTSLAQAQFHVVHDAPNTTSTPDIHPVILSDGSTLTRRMVGHDLVFRKYDAQGTLVWNRLLEGTASWNTGGQRMAPVISDGNGGFWFAARTGEEVMFDPEVMEDTVTVKYSVLHVDANGAVISSAGFTKRYVAFMPHFPYLSGLAMARTPDDGVVLCLSISEPSEQTEVIKLNALGELQWTVSVPYQFATTFARVAVAPNGRIYLTGTEGVSFANIQLVELDSDGSLLGAWRYIYGNTNPMINTHDIAVDAVGKVHVAALLSSTVGVFQMFLRLGPGGVLERGDLYRRAYNISAGELRIDAAGRRYHTFSTNVNGMSMTQRDGFLIADTLGSPARYVRRADVVIAPNNVALISTGMDLVGDKLAWAGYLSHEHMDLAYTTRYETLALLDVDDISLCLMADSTFAHIAIPLDPVMTTEPLTLSLTDITQHYFAETWAPVMSDLDADALDPMCPFVSELLGVVTAVPTGDAHTQQPLVRNTLVSAGTSILLSSATPHVEVYDQQGALVFREHASNTQAIPTARWAPGIYVVRGTNQAGVLLGTTRVVVQ